ncbi:MAG: DUF1194 domain-containing protein [Rhodobacteraceae bacterium]|nr:DUF1194 domain-containing protein [Paracoccaceae bacterium]
MSLKRQSLKSLQAAALTSPVFACHLSLILALDVSASVDAREYKLQQEGVASALVDPDVSRMILSQGGIWIMAFEWSGSRHQYPQMQWTFLGDMAAINAASEQLRVARRRVNEFPTSLGYALGRALQELRKAPEVCVRRVVDVAGDGVNNDGFPPASAYRANDMTGITINGLVIEGETPPPAPYYLEQVIRGPGAFVEVADDYDDYARAMRRKLLRELSYGSMAKLQ